MSDSQTDRRRHAIQFGLAVTFFSLAVLIAFGSVVRSLWLYPLNHIW